MIQKWELVHSFRFINVFEDLKENMNTMLKNCSEETETMRRLKENWSTQKIQMGNQLIRCVVCNPALGSLSRMLDRERGFVASSVSS